MSSLKRVSGITAMLAALAMAVVSPASASTLEVGLETVFPAISADLPVLPAAADECIAVPVGVALDSCDDEAWRLGVATAGCLIGAVGFFKAGKTIKAAGKAIKQGGNVKQIIYGAVGAFFCTDVWNSFWDWSDCANDAGMQDIFNPAYLGPVSDADEGGDENLGQVFVDIGDTLLGAP